MGGGEEGRGARHGLRPPPRDKLWIRPLVMNAAGDEFLNQPPFRHTGREMLIPTSSDVRLCVHSRQPITTIVLLPCLHVQAFARRRALRLQSIPGGKYSVSRRYTVTISSDFKDDARFTWSICLENFL